MTVVADTPDGLVVIVGDALPLWTPRYGAFMEQSGRNQWQPVASARLAKTAQTSENRCRGFHALLSATGGTMRSLSQVSLPANRHQLLSAWAIA